jgi:hypothetical protein
MVIIITIQKNKYWIHKVLILWLNFVSRFKRLIYLFTSEFVSEINCGAALKSINEINEMVLVTRDKVLLCMNLSIVE